MNELVSIIVPIYNVEEYLPECVHSIVNQTFTNLDIVLVDDGSTDNSGILCDELGKQDARIRVIHKDNGGLSSARNTGLDICGGDYVYFLDSDDYIEETVIERYLSIIKATNAEICRGSFFSFTGKVNKIIFNSNATPETYSAVDAVKLTLMDNKLTHAACGALYKKELFNGIRFPVGLLYEDFATTYYVMTRCDKVAFVDDQSYFYRMRPDSIMKATVSKKNMVLLDIAEKVTRDMIAIYPEVEKEAVRKVVVTYLKFYSRILYSGFRSFEEEQTRIRAIVLDNADLFIESGLASINDRIKMTAFKLGKLPFFLVYKVSDWIQQIRLTI